MRRMTVQPIARRVASIAALACGLKARSGLREAPTVFESTLAELEKDREIFRGKS